MPVEIIAFWLQMCSFVMIGAVVGAVAILLIRAYVRKGCR